MTTQHDILSNLERLLTILASTAEDVKRLEDEAKRLLHRGGDTNGHRDQLRQKAILLSGLSDKAAELTDLPPRISAMVKERVGGFSFEAERALRVDSVFYMAILLCPEDHKDGMPNELDTLIGHLQQELAFLQTGQ